MWFETSGIGVSWDNIDQPVYRTDIWLMMKIMFFAFFYLTIIGVYLDQITQSTFGVRKHPCFFLSPSYWGLSCRGKKQLSKVARQQQLYN